MFVGVSAYLITREWRTIKLLENVERWAEKSGRTIEDKALAKEIRKAFEEEREDIWSDGFMPDKALVERAWSIAEREGFDARKPAWLHGSYAAGSATLGAIIGANSDNQKKKYTEKVERDSIQISKETSPNR